MMEWVHGTALSYLALALAARGMNWKPAEGPSMVLACHNLILSAASLAMFLGLLKATMDRPSDFLFCEPKNSKDDAYYFWVYMYYLSKYYELLDTVLAFLCRGKGPRHFLMHVYHHCYVLYMAYFYVQGQTLAGLGILANTFVHIFMYLYYARSALGWETPWKNWITRLQIIQFLTSFALLVTAILKRPSWSQFDTDCAGLRPLVANAVFNLTLLLLFVNVLKSSKKRQKSL